ncbi:MAG: hypothetical protein JXN61_18455 [Sedimentisphaerales bacterium]|nr:hypothetical protein [Sedimentisphaerales bacterium]
MSKRELIDCICEINTSAKPEFLANFSEEDLTEYLEHLMELDLEELAFCSKELWGRRRASRQEGSASSRIVSDGHSPRRQYPDLSLHLLPIH